ncbi:hypothetical protein PUMCH_000200 [Australozyma saopauloensis]|uniref:Fe2OG dioxygenase domain-containing protein n=1 Tax=Australozyma saopauloensis TaxID=291208 RepID=A0AAX4H4R0_9ASCO|nr:hypothetical protein PUMCH_000200 [[Candida] saopauloensis]
MSAAVATDLNSDIIRGNRRKSVPEETYNKALARTFLQLEAKYGSVDHIKFDPDVHLAYYAGSLEDKARFHSIRRITMEELKLTNAKQISPIGVTDAFPLFTEEAIDIMKLEVLRKLTFLEHARYSNSSTSGLDCMVRGYVKDNEKIINPFIYDAWTHPKTMELVSLMAGVDLEIVMDYEIAHVNLGVCDEGTAEEQRMAHEQTKREKVFAGEEDGSDIPAIVGWHHDSYPFVCVLMLSDTSEMIGGETYLRTGDNKITKVSGPTKGAAAMLQGRLISHLAPKPVGASERITMVTSYRPKDPECHEGSVLSTVKPEIEYGSIYNSFYRQWVQYRADLVKKRLDKLIDNVKSNEVFDKEGVTKCLTDIESYLKNTYKEMEVTEDEWDRIRMKG